MLNDHLEINRISEEYLKCHIRASGHFKVVYLEPQAVSLRNMSLEEVWTLARSLCVTFKVDPCLLG